MYASAGQKGARWKGFQLRDTSEYARVNRCDAVGIEDFTRLLRSGMPFCATDYFRDANDENPANAPYGMAVSPLFWIDQS